MTTTINADNGVSSGSAGLKSSADSSGVLALQTNGTTAISIDTSQAVTVNGNTTLGDASTDTILMTGAPSIGGAGYGMGMGFRNRIINGAMVIDQRNAGASVTPTSGQYLVDRWEAQLSAASKYSVQQNAGSVTPPAGFVNYLGATSLSAYSAGASEFFGLEQRIEGYNIADLSWGTANAKAITISAWVYSSLTGTFGGSIYNDTGARSYPFTYSISTANTWTQISVTIAGDTSGTWLKTNGIGLQVLFSLGAGTTVSGTAGAWSGTLYRSATGATSVVGTNGATFYITGVQLEKGSTATSFDYRPYGTELALCQRYLEIWTSVNSVYVNPAAGYNNGYLASGPSFHVTKRAAPTLTAYGVNGYPTGATGKYDKDGVGDANITLYSATVDSFRISGLTSPYSGQFAFKAESEL